MLNPMRHPNPPEESPLAASRALEPVLLLALVVGLFALAYAPALSQVLQWFRSAVNPILLQTP